MKRELYSLSKQSSLERKPRRKSGNQKAVNEHDKLPWGWSMLQGKKKKTPKNTKKHNKHMLQHMLIETASYPSADKSMINDPK